ncbi:DUF2207 domain-containing protein [Sporosarcina siberiensis]|uniref:DUF2207 domain-containing protein n=1 Tax=Sporosarcina siberiensis TaxID=1365606 RepID=A0ABW4SK54_9BACL
MKRTMILFLFLVAVLFPTAAFAVDFEISDVMITVDLQPSGDAVVIEKHTYVFDSKFKGIIRTLIAKKGSAIADFKAYENGETLEVEQNKGEYKVFRSGNDETVVVEMHYEIVNAVQKYDDGAEFYWPFFDNRNETDYKNMTIEVFPPSPANDVQYLGYDVAYKKGSLDLEGMVTFAMGYVPSGENGDVRVVYESELFPDATALKGTIRDELIAEETKMADKEAAFIVGRANTANYGFPLMAGFGVFLLGLIGWGTISSRRKKSNVKVREAEFSVPAGEMSMPATIHYTTGNGFSPEATSAALLDLVRKGYVKQLSDDEFECISRDVDYPHEERLIKLLFGYIGKDEIFKIKDLEVYTKNKKNHASYNAALLKWREGITEEIKSKELYEQKVGLRWIIALLSTAMIVVTIQFGIYDLFMYMAITIVLMIIGLSFAIFYKPRNKEGYRIFQEWHQFKKAFRDLDLDEWKRLSTDDKFRSYTYAIGCGDKSFGKQFTEFAEAETRTNRESSNFGNMSFIYFNPIMMTSSFVSANTNTAASDSSSSYSGGGTGGGGGGSGAF